MSFFKLLSIENFKLWKRLSVRVMFILMVVLAVGYCGGAKYLDYINHKNAPSTSSSQSSDWRQEQEMIVQSVPEQIKAAKDSKSRTDDVAISSMEKQLAEAKYRLAHNVAPQSQMDTFWGWMTLMSDNTQVPNIGYFVLLFCILFVSTAVAGEFTEGTMKMALSRPFSRAQILTAKIASAVLYMLILTGVAFGITFLGTGLLRGGFGGMAAKDLLWTGSEVLYVPAGLKVLALYGLELLTSLFLIGFTLLLAVLSRSRSIATGVSLFMLFIGVSLFRLLGIFFDWGKFTAFPVSNFVSFVTSGSSLPGTSLGFALIVCGVYLAAFVTASYVVFQKRDV